MAQEDVMENLYVWLLISGGAILGLSGILLFAWDQKRGKRRQFDEPGRNDQYAEAPELVDKIAFLSRRLEESQRRVEELQRAGARSDQYSEVQSDLAEARQQVDKVMTRNRDLLDEVDSLSTKLAVSQKTVEDLLKLEDLVSGAELENQRLRTENQEFQHEIGSIRTQLQTSESRVGESARQNQEPADHISKLDTETLELKHRLDTSEKTIEELQAERQYLGGVKDENQQLQQEITSLRNDLQASQTRLLESARESQETADHYARAQTEIAELKQQAEKGQSMAVELEAVRQQLADVESRETLFKNQQHDLAAEVVDLQRELSEEKDRVRELELTRGHLAQMEHVCRKLRDENCRLEEEKTRWQERLARSEEHERQIGILRQQLDELTKQALLIDSEDQVHKELAAGGLVGGSWRRRPDSDPSSAPQNMINASVESTPKPIDAPVPYEPHAAKEKETGHGIWGSAQQKWSFRIVPVTGVIATAAAVAVGFMGPSSDEFSGSKKPVVASKMVVPGEPKSQNEAASETSQKPGPAPAEKDESSKPIQKTKPSPRLRGAFEITRPTQVYSGPSEITLAIARIEPGTKINVIDSRDGWLEIRSKHGRPPGFIRQEAAVRIDPKQG
jgi:hypothetical protein